MLTRDRILEIRKQTTMHAMSDGAQVLNPITFARAIEAATIEACAMICDGLAEGYYDHAKPPYKKCAAAIRASAAERAK